MNVHVVNTGKLEGDRNHGFTLVEVVIVLFILALMAGVAVQRVTSSEKRWLHAEAVILKLRLNHASDRALIRHEPIIWHYDANENSYRFTIRSSADDWVELSHEGLGKHRLKHSAELRLEGAQRPVGDGSTPALVFYPGGEYSPFTLSLISKKNYSYVLYGDGFNEVRLRTPSP